MGYPNSWMIMANPKQKWMDRQIDIDRQIDGWIDRSLELVSI